MKPDSVLYSSKSTEHLTPPEVIERAIRVMGKISVDPCAETKQNPNIPAKVHFTKEDDGLTQSWAVEKEATTLVNPPYRRKIISQWVEKIVTEYETGAIAQATVLVPFRPDPNWFKPLKRYPICGPEYRLHFGSATNMAGATFPSAIVYLGNRYDPFVRVFEEMGPIWLSSRALLPFCKICPKNREG